WYPAEFAIMPPLRDGVGDCPSPSCSRVDASETEPQLGSSRSRPRQSIAPRVQNPNIDECRPASITIPAVSMHRTAIGPVGAADASPLRSAIYLALGS